MPIVSNKSFEVDGEVLTYQPYDENSDYSVDYDGHEIVIVNDTTNTVVAIFDVDDVQEWHERQRDHYCPGDYWTPAYGYTEEDWAEVFKENIEEIALEYYANLE